MNAKAVDMLTQEQIAKIASEVWRLKTATVSTDRKGEIFFNESGSGNEEYRNKHLIWNPELGEYSKDLFRSQAFAMVEWLLNRATSLQNDREDYCLTIAQLVSVKDIEALHQMVWELME